MSNILFKWFTDNLLKTNLEKSHFVMNSTQQTQINIGVTTISNSKCENLLDITLITR